MKNQIKISLAILSALVISADAQAMFRARLAQPQMPRMAQHSFGFGKTQEFKMPMPAAERRRVNEQFLNNSVAHKGLVAKRNEMALEAKNSTKSFIKYTLYSTVMTELGMRLPDLTAFSLLFGGLYYSAISYGNFRDMRSCNKQKKALEAEIAELLKEQKREIALADDIQ